MRPSTHAVLVMLAALTKVSSAAAQAAAPPPGAPPPAATPAAPAAAPAAPAAPAAAPAAAPSPAAAAPAPAAPAAAPAAPAPSVLDKISADAFVDAYGAFNTNGPKPQGPAVSGGIAVGGNSFRAFDAAEGFSLNWAGVNASYAADPIGGTIGLRIGPGAVLYNTGQDNAYGLTLVKQAYATWKPADKLTLDFGKWDQPYGSEVADSQLNMNYTRSVLFWFMQPLFFTGLRVDYAASDQFDFKVFAANGWNNTIDNNRGKTFGVQAMIKPMDQLVLYLGYVGGPEQQDYTIPGGGMALVGNVPDANSHFRHMVDFVADFNPTSALRFLLNADYRTEDSVPTPGTTDTHTESAFGGNLVVRYAFTDSFSGSLRGEYYHDEHGDTLGTGTKTDIEDGTLTLMYGVGNHLAFMFDARYDHANNSIFQKDASDSNDSQFTATLGIIASTK